MKGKIWWKHKRSAQQAGPIGWLMLAFFVVLLAMAGTRADSLPTAVAQEDPPEQPAAEPDWSQSWSMAGANPQRTSWTNEEVRGFLRPVWSKPFEPYISQKVQIIAANDTLYVSTSNGLYALVAQTGTQRWVYPTKMPLSHSPTIYNGVAYVGGFDNKIHAINANNGTAVWTFEADAGFETSMLVVNDTVYAGNRDGYFYAVNASNGTLRWRYKTDGAIRYSAAYKENASGSTDYVFFASQDGHAYALNAANGQLAWKSAKLGGAGFTSYWPVVYENRVIFSGSNNYRFAIDPGPNSQLAEMERVEVHNEAPRGTPIGALGQASGDWVNGTATINANRIYNYFQNKPWRKTVFVLDIQNGQERETAPVLWTGNDGSGTRFPPVIGSDGVLYQQNSYLSDEHIAGGHVSGWQPGFPYISVVSTDWGAVDEPHAVSAGGDMIYWNLCCDRQGGGFDITLPNLGALDGEITGGPDSSREWIYYTYNTGTGDGLMERLPNYNVRYFSPHQTYTKPYAAFRGPEGGANGVYGFHSDGNPPVPYEGMVFMHRSNAVIAFAPDSTSANELPIAQTVDVADANMTPPTSTELQALLEQEIQEILNAGHLRPGYHSHGHFDLRGVSTCGDDLVDYWHNSSETIYTLLKALPYLPVGMQADVRAYVQSQMTNYPPYDYNHVGWANGAAREPFILPPEVASELSGIGPRTKNFNFEWDRNPFMYYALWQYAEEFGNAASLYNASRNDMPDVPSNQVLLQSPFIHNAFIAGYIGYLELQKLAGQSESAAMRSELNRLIDLRVDNFTKDSAFADDVTYCRTLNVASNFMYLVPELAEELRTRALGRVTAAIDEYEQMAPFWFVSFAPEGYAENPKAPLYDGHALFMAKALILEESPAELSQYLDVPGFSVGDLYYIDKLVSLLREGLAVSVNPASTASIEGRQTVNFTISVSPLGGFSDVVSVSAPSPSSNLSVQVFGSPATPPADVTVRATHTGNVNEKAIYTIPVTVSGGGTTQQLSLHVIVNADKTYLPLISR